VGQRLHRCLNPVVASILRLDRLSHLHLSKMEGVVQVSWKVGGDDDAIWIGRRFVMTTRSGSVVGLFCSDMTLPYCLGPIGALGEQVLVG
jgi:hypothetical protein